MSDAVPSKEKLSAKTLAARLREAASLLEEAAETLEQREAELRAVCPGRDAAHEWQRDRERYGDDADGNRGTWVYFEKCTHCGEERYE